MPPPFSAPVIRSGEPRDWLCRAHKKGLHKIFRPLNFMAPELGSNNDKRIYDHIIQGASYSSGHSDTPWRLIRVDLFQLRLDIRDNLIDRFCDLLRLFSGGRVVLPLDCHCECQFVLVQFADLPIEVRRTQLKRSTAKKL